MRVCPMLHGPSEIDPGFFASPVPLPLTRTLEDCLGRFNDPKRAGYNPAYRWGDDDDKVGHKGLDLGAPTGAAATAMADGKVAHVDLVNAYPVDPNDAAGVWVAVLHKCPECPGWFLSRHLHLMVGSVVVKAGQTVAKRQTLARCDTTGSAHWPHTHTDLRHSSDPNADKAASFGPKWGVPYDPVTWGILGVTPPAPPPAQTLVTITVDRPVLRGGSEGPAVWELQTALNLYGFTPGVIDGKYGGNTVAAVIAFQISKGLTADGVAGRNTLTALMDY